MISFSSGEITFEKLRIAPQMLLNAPSMKKIHALPVQGWCHHNLGVQNSDRGTFDVEAVSDTRDRIQLVLLSHSHPFYQPDTVDDAERRVYHEEVISRDLGGQREFSWGHVFCRVHAQANRDWLVLAYTLGPHIPKPAAEILSYLYARQPGDD